ncbi:ABC transporter ATP-binding protein [Limisphaera ngatamarikiensis]|jgi:ABC-2 type transport system ATP-binding protein|uniref:ABC transporter ATP-binding protein n=1 Tax=Limisphaera ngatamarikiensis TaxID=1324935 RepID=A0A6M1RY64_9BACT|nr:ABC transporter ATP-binding protein [Limisphaera ngatamarikiensis]NGO40441.1 ABC transporter ATP-binding protein [Limisphaera ngatamarikiensis]
MATIIETRGLTRHYGRQTAVDRLDLEVREGEIFGFLGPNGAGKTTTILMLLGLTEPSAGSARVLGHDPVLDPLPIKRQVGYLPENVGFYDDLTARENLQYIADLNAIPRAEAARKIESALATVGLGDVGDKPVGAFSRGMRQRLGIAELLVKDPRLMILDEPTLGLDPDGTLKMLDLIRDLNRSRGITVMFSSHLLDQVQRICHRVGIMIQGRLVAVGTIEELARRKLGDASGPSLEEIYMRYFKEG